MAPRAQDLRPAAFHAEEDRIDREEIRTVLPPAGRGHCIGSTIGGAFILTSGSRETRPSSVLPYRARREIHVLSAFAHPNVIRLLCYTSTSAGVSEEICLVYELEQGSLDKMLVTAEKAQDLSSKIRVRDAAGISRAPNYLHCHDPRGPAFHRDVKSSNVVLDLRLRPLQD